MPVKKATKKQEVEVNVEEEVKNESSVENEVENEVEQKEEVEVNAEEEVEQKEESNSTLEVNTEVADVSNAPKEKNVRIKVKKDLSFYFGKERYDFKAGQCVNVPVAVKLHLAKQDVLLPL